MYLDRDRIINGTDQKRFNRMRKELSEEYTESGAKDFLCEYRTKPISFLLKNSRDIFSETYYGLDFYRDLICNKPLNPLVYTSELEKVKAFIDEVKRKRLPDAQVAGYISLQELLEKMCSSNKNLSHVFKRASIFDGYNDYFENFFDLLNSCDDHPELLSKVTKVVFNRAGNPYFGIPAGYFVCLKYPQYSGNLLELSRCTKSEENSCCKEDICNKEKKRLCVREMMQDEGVSKSVANMPNVNLYPTWAKYGNSSPKVVLPKQEPLSMNGYRFNGTISNPVQAAYESVEECDLRNYAYEKKYDYLHKLQGYVSAYMEYMEEEMLMGERAENDPEYDKYESIMEEAEAEISFMEWEDDGSPNAVLKNHISTSKEREAEARRKEKEKNHINDSSDDDKESKKEEDEDSEDSEEVTESGDFSFFEDGKEVKKDEDKKEDNAQPRVVPDSSDPNNKNPQKPKQDMATKVQNKALDADAKLTQKEAQLGEKVQKFKNAGNAVAQHPKKLFKGVDQTIADFDTWDDNRRKNFLLKPGYRHKIFKKFRTALSYGIVAKINLAWVPILWAIRHLSKQKDARIRNELALELDNEIKICEEKINDANAKGDTKSKYELMRIKDKLDAERTRVRLNSKYV